MIRQFGFIRAAINWLPVGCGLLFALSPLQVQTVIKKFLLELKNESLSEALKQSEKAGGKDVLFAYNGIKSYRVIVSIRGKTEREAIDLVLIGKPSPCIKREEYLIVQRRKSDGTIAIEGKAYDEKEAPLPSADTLALAADSSFLAGSVTGEDGSFYLPPVAGEDCLLKVTYIGCRPRIVPCRQQNTICLRPNAELLKEAVVTASRPLIERKDRTLAANIAGAPPSLMGSVKEMIPHLPFVTGSDGEFTILGRGTSETYTSSREVRDKAELDRLQANEILSAEIIITPGVRYGSSVGAVIRLRTTRRRGQRMSGSFYTDYSQGCEPIGNESISLNYRISRLDIFVKGNFAEINNYRAGISSQDIYVSPNWNQSAEDKNRQTYRIFNGEPGFSYEIDENQSSGMRYMPGMNIGNAHTINEGATPTLQDGKEVGQLHTLCQTDTHTGWWQAANGYYNDTFGKWNIDFNADYLHGRGRIRQYAENNETEDAISSNRVRNHLYATKLLLTAPPWKGKLSFGTEEAFTNRYDVLLQSGFFTNADDRIKQTMLSGLIDYILSLRKLDILAGLRYEYQRTDHYERGIHQDGQSPIYRDWISVISIRYTSGNWFFTLSHRTLKYSPSYDMFASAITYQSKYSYQSGGPFLIPQIHRVTFLDAGWKWVNFSLSYDYCWNMCTDYIRPYDDASRPSTPLFGRASIPHTSIYGTNIVLSSKIGIQQPQFAANVNWYDLHAVYIDIFQSWNEPRFRFSSDNNFSFLESWFFNIKEVFSPGVKQSYAIWKIKGGVDAQLTKSFLKDQALKVSVTVKDLFHTTHKYFTIYGDRIFSSSRDYLDQQRFGIRLSYQFSTTKSKYKGAGAGTSEKSRL